MTLSTSSPQSASLVERWIGLTTRSDFHPNTPAPITTFSITFLPPDAELISHVQHKHTGSPIQPTSFNSTSKTFYESNWKDYIIIPSRARDNNITNWKQFWSKFSNFVNKNPGSYSTFYRFQTGHLYHQLNMNQKETCCFCNQSDHNNSNEHILDECIITDRIWRLVQQGTTHKMNSKHAPLHITQQEIMGKIMPPQHYVKINIYLEILIKISTHHFSPSPKFHIDIPINVTATQLKKVVKKVVQYYQYPITIN
ncbi:unnamed protein product [Ambrosiozyma monospora]|uniref:Unnamed protein product n=1 Tax=Ambrosiozyma monospora TaxID=43982 RepID=A0ACB5SRP4_AMBMO|nr:unnamed protein product [Ambrosiozyma monospora]